MDDLQIVKYTRWRGLDMCIWAFLKKRTHSNPTKLPNKFSLTCTLMRFWPYNYNRWTHWFTTTKRSFWKLFFLVSYLKSGSLRYHMGSSFLDCDQNCFHCNTTSQPFTNNALTSFVVASARMPIVAILRGCEENRLIRDVLQYFLKWSWITGISLKEKISYLIVILISSWVSLDFYSIANTHETEVMKFNFRCIDDLWTKNLYFYSTAPE